MFVPDYRKMNVLPMYVITRTKDEVMRVISRFADFVGTCRVLIGFTGVFCFISMLIPYCFHDDVLREIEDYAVTIIRAFRHERWRPDAGFSLYSPDEGLLFPNMKNLKEYAESIDKNVKEWSREKCHKSPDAIDLAIILTKVVSGAYFRPLYKALQNLRKYGLSSLPSFQLTSYHYNTHVKAL